MVLQDGFAFDGRPYSNLSEIARVITGTRWDGPRFFGLRAEPLGEAAANAKNSRSKTAPTSHKRER